MTSQTNLFSAPVCDLPKGVTAVEQAELRAHLVSHGWQTRQAVTAALGWDERKLRAVAESLGADVVRCQLGYKLTMACDRNDVPYALQACDAFESQAKKNLAYAQSLRRKIHSIVG
jgi:hypothetical protein